MEPDLVLGFAFIILGAFCGGSFGLPSKFVPAKTPWEALWGVFFFLATILIPVTLGPLVVDGLFASCSAAGLAALAGPLIFGFLWGLGSMTLGLSFAFIGLSLAYAINYGAQITAGSMMPMIIHHPGDALTRHGAVIMLGVVVCLVGVVFAGRAGILKSRSLERARRESGGGAGSYSMLKGLLLAFASGILCACYAVAFSFGEPVMEVSQEKFGNPAWRSTFVVTALVLWGGSASSCLYCAFKLTRNGTWNTLARPGIGKVLLIAGFMACLHDGAILFWGLGASNLGPLGVAVGYAVFMSLCIVVGNLNGYLTGEWRGASRDGKVWLIVGIALLILGVCVLARGNALKLDEDGSAARPRSTEGV